jgi:hypothetical protein
MLTEPPPQSGRMARLTLADLSHALSGNERLLHEASERAMRHPAGRVALVLHLSRLAPPAPRPHHIRVARVLLQDSAQRFGGQVIGLRNQDLVLLGAESGAANADQPHAPVNLPATLARLFAADVPDPARLVSLWHLQTEAASLTAYLAERAADKPDEESSAGAAPESALSLAELQETLAHAPLPELMAQQTGMVLDADRRRPLDDRLTPAFRELSLSLAGLRLRPLVAQAVGDPYLYRHFAAALDTRLIQLLHDDLARSGRITRPAVGGLGAVHIELGLEAILSPAFARLSSLAQSAGVRLWVSIPFMPLCHDADLMDHARRILDLTGCAMIMNRVDALALAFLRQAAMSPSLIKLAWTRHLAEIAIGSPASHALAGIDPACLALTGVDSDQALIWGQARGIALFQGPFLDQIMAATRMAQCDSASLCTMRQCSSRATALGPSGRVGCANPGLLDTRFRAAS